MNEDNRYKPSTIADDVAVRMIKLNAKKEQEEDPNMRFRDLDAEKSMESRKETDIEKKAAESPKQKTAEIVPPELIIEKLKFDNNIDADDIDIIGDSHSIEKEKDERKREEEIAAKKEKDKREEEANLSMTKGGGILAAARNIVQRLLAFKMHSIRALGDQAGIFDNPNVNPKGRDVSKKRYVKHDLSMGAETVEKKFTVDVGGGMKVTGSISGKVESVGGANVFVKNSGKISVDSASVGGSNVSTKSLGGLSSGNILDAISRGGTGMGR